MSETQHTPPPTTSLLTPAGPIPSPTEVIAACPRLPTGPVTAPSPVFRDYTPTLLTPSSIDGGEAVRKSSRLKKEEVYDFNAPVVLHEYIVEKGMAVDEILLRFGFALCENDTMWYHPHAQFKCQSKDELICKWRRGTILRCCITTEIITTNESGVPVVDLDPLGSLYHPKCVNDKCRWSTSKQMMRLEKGQLVTCELSSGQLFALRTREKGKWYGPCQDVYPRDIEAKPFSKNPHPESVKRRTITLSNTPSSASTDQLPGQNPPSTSPESIPPSPAKSTVVTYGKRKRSKAGPSRRRSRPKPAPITTPDPSDTHDIASERSHEEEEGFDADVTDGSVLKDHFIVSKRHYHMLEAKIKSLETSFDRAAAPYNGAEQDADHQKSSAQQSQAGLKQSTDRLAASAKKIGELEKSQGTLQSELEAAMKEVESQKGLAKDWKDAATIAVRALAVEKQKVRDLEEREKAAVKERTALQEDKAALEKENAELKVEVTTEKAKVEEVVNKGRRLFEGFSSK